MEDTNKTITAQISDDDIVEENISMHENDYVEDSDTNLISSNSGGIVSENDVVDENTISAPVGAQGHWGIDDDTG